MRTVTFDEKQVMELEQIMTDSDGKAALEFVQKLIEKIKKADEHRSCDQSARSF
ncbi:MAG: hypothetical protein JSV16_15140 [Candidatus Hydrogenedentota bacterium]|nr:MAG: hypothetical protein JSV16_15140 [Candidatus Hydrogenedentota bacterium]